MTHIIIGAAGIGQHHARIFSRLGVKISSIVGKTQTSAEKTAVFLQKTYNIRPKALCQISDIFQDGEIKSASICSPTPLHYDHINLLLGRGVAIFCEKPLFWNWGLDSRAALSLLSTISTNKNRRFTTNNSSEHYVKSLNVPPNVPSFSFTFKTRGRNRYQDIAVDLMPHGLTMLYELLGEREVTDYNVEEVQEFSYLVHFKYGNCDVSFYFWQNQVDSEFSFQVVNKRFERIQKISNGCYRVYIRSVDTGEIFELEDPFRSSIQEFVEDVYLRPTQFLRSFEKSVFLQKILIKMLLR